MQPRTEQHGRPTHGRETKRTPVFIPDSARVVKAWFQDEPSRQKVREIVRHVSETGEAHTHPDITYGEIPEGAEVRFLAKFSLAEKFKYDADRWCVCAVCSHDLPQFKDNGVVCWLPQEGTIKIMGGDCYKRRNPEAYEIAEARFRDDEKARKNETYLLTRLRYVPQLRAALEQDIAVAFAFDMVRAHFHRAIREHGLMELPRLIQKGKLHLLEQKTTVDYRSGARRSVAVKTDYAPIQGAEFLGTTGKAFHMRLQTVREALTLLDFGHNWDHAVMAMSDLNKSTCAKAYGEALKQWQGTRKDLEKMRRFIQPVVGRTIARWSVQPAAPMLFLFEYQVDAIRIGISPNRSELIEIPILAREALATLPTIAAARSP